MKNYSDNYEVYGFHKDIYYNRKYYGSIKMDKPDRKTMGYMGRREEILSEDFIRKNKKLKKGMKVITECIPLCGKLKGTLKEKINKLEQSKVWFNYGLYPEKDF